MAGGWIRRSRGCSCCGNRCRRRVKVREAIRVVKDDGWVLARTTGSHRQFKHGQKTGLVAISGKPSDTLAPGTANSILKQAGLKP